jgi:hypothetical protein
MARTAGKTMPNNQNPPSREQQKGLFFALQTSRQRYAVGSSMKASLGLTRIIIQLAVALVGSASLLGQAEGYVNVDCPPGFTLFGFPLIGYPTNDLVYPADNSTGIYNGCEVLFWQNGTWVNYFAENDSPDVATNGWVEPAGRQILSPGAGAVFYNPNTNGVVITLFGAVPTGRLTNTLTPGLNLVSSILTTFGNLSSQLLFPSLAAGQFDGDQVFLYFNNPNGNSGYTMFTADSLNYNPPANHGWDGLPAEPDPLIATAQAFWYRAGNGSVQWVQTFIIGQTEYSSPNAAATSGVATSKTSSGVSVRSRKFDAAGSAAISKNRHFQFTLTGEPGKTHVVEASPDLKTWQSIETNLWSSGKFIFTDPAPATNKMRFYRAFAAP